MANRMQSEASNPENDLKDPVQANSSDIDERMTRDYKEAIDKTDVITEESIRRIVPESSTAYREPSEEEIDISWRPDPSGHPRRTF
ncbi:hypothetical protein ACN38_g1228 [Penicillium nordicum]|uniref:Uncharacterized protein n=1 Tax=Penicillium nordicum TaxID=229535 RepID=A0A0M8PHF9_9EURO|nr:hypothetical protein ACN38_g1228 [Penicillium nordicum]